MSGSDIDHNLRRSETLVLFPVRAEEKQAAIHTVCMNVAVQGTKDAATILQALGLIPYK